MSILINKDTRVMTQGMTGKVVSSIRRTAKAMRMGRTVLLRESPPASLDKATRASQYSIAWRKLERKPGQRSR